MNNIEKAIEQLEAQVVCTDNVLSINSCNIAISALEKQKSKKPKEQEINNSGDLIGLCSVCRKRWVNKYQKYCAECGTRLDWSVEE